MVGFRVVERLARSADQAVSAQGQQDCHWPGREIQLASQNAAEFMTLLRSRTHQGYLWIVPVEPAFLKLRRNSFGRTKVHHIEATCGNDRRHTVTGGSFQALGSSREH